MTKARFAECDQIDSEISNMTAKCFQIDFSTLSPFLQKHIILPINLGGMGVRQLKKRRWSEYIGGIMGGLVPLLDRQSEDGFQDRKLENNHIIIISNIGSERQLSIHKMAHGINCLPTDHRVKSAKVSEFPSKACHTSTVIRSTILTITFSTPASFIMLRPLQALPLMENSNEAP